MMKSSVRTVTHDHRPSDCLPKLMFVLRSRFKCVLAVSFFVAFCALVTMFSVMYPSHSIVITNARSYSLSSNVQTLSASSDGDQSGKSCPDHLYTKGTWAREVDSSTMRQKTGLIMGEELFWDDSEFYSNLSQPWAWRWQPSSPICRLQRFDAERWCNSNMNVLIVGDSLSEDHFEELEQQLLGAALQSGSKYKFHQIEEESFHLECENDAGATTSIRFVRNNGLTIGRRGLSPLCRCSPWTHLLEHTDVLVLNSGLHFTGRLQQFEDAIATVAGYLRENFDGRVIFRTSARGHPHCMTMLSPITESRADQLDYSVMYGWNTIPELNQIALTQLRSTLGSTRLEVLDIEPMTRLRPDGHVSTLDCLHYRRSGVISFWSLLLFNQVLGNI